MTAKLEYPDRIVFYTPANQFTGFSWKANLVIPIPFTYSSFLKILLHQKKSVFFADDFGETEIGVNENSFDFSFKLYGKWYQNKGIIL